jgi:methyl-accepting chemotaxis protein
MGHEAVPAVADPAAAVPAEGAPVISPDIEARLQRADEMLSEVRAAVSLLTRADPDTGAPLLHPGTNRKMLREVAARQDQIRDLLTEIRGLLRDTTRATDQQRATVEAMRGEVNSLREEVRSVIR